MLKKEKGFTLIEVMVGAVLFLILFIGASYILKDRAERTRFDDLAYQQAYELHELAKVYNRYARDNINSLPDIVTVDRLIVEGYLEGDSSRFESPLGLTPTLLVQKDESGIPLTMMVAFEGQESDRRLSNFNLESTERQRQLYDQTVENINTMITNESFSTGNFFTANKRVVWPNSDKSMNLTDYIEESRLSDISSISPAIFLSLQREPGFFLINVSVTEFVDEQSSIHSIEGLGYSRFCPTNGIRVGEDNYNSFDNVFTALPDDIELLGRAQGNFSKTFYLCLPVSEFDSERYSREDFSSSINIVANSNAAPSIANNQCVTLRHANFGIEFDLRGNKFKFIGNTGRRDARCRFSDIYMYQHYSLSEGAFEYNTFDMILNIDQNSPINIVGDTSNPNFAFIGSGSPGYIPVSKININY